MSYKLQISRQLASIHPSLFYHHSDFIADELHFLLAQAGSGPHAGSITTGHERNWEIIAKFCCQGNKATLIILKH